MHLTFISIDAAGIYQSHFIILVDMSKNSHDNERTCMRIARLSLWVRSEASGWLTWSLVDMMLGPTITLPLKSSHQVSAYSGSGCCTQNRYVINDVHFSRIVQCEARLLSHRWFCISRLLGPMRCQSLDPSLGLCGFSHCSLSVSSPKTNKLVF